MSHPTICPTEIKNTIVQDNVRLAEHASDLEKIMNILTAENDTLKQELIRIREQADIEVVYDVKKPVKKRVPKKKVIKPDPVLVDSLDAVPVVDVSCVCVVPAECLPTDTTIYDAMKKPALIELATGLGLKGVKKISRANIIAAIVKAKNGGVKPILDHLPPPTQA